MQLSHSPSKPIILCLNDSIFKDKHSKINSSRKQNYRNPKDQDHLKRKTQKIQPQTKMLKAMSIQFLNASYFGKATNNKEPAGQGIFIDDQFNFFLSNWKSNHKMNGLTLAILLNGVKIYGIWIDGKPNGWNCIEMKKGIKIFIQIKTSLQGKFYIQQPALLVDEQKQIAYLMKVQKSMTMYTKIQIINRKQIPQYFVKNKAKSFIDLQDIFEQGFFNIKIPNFLFSFQNFLSHLKENIPEVQLKIIEKNYQKLTFISIKDVTQQKQIRKSKYFIPFTDLFNQTQLFYEQQNKIRLGILQDSKNYKTKTIGQFSNRYDLKGKGLSFSSKSSSSQSCLFGIFKSDMLIKQFQHSVPFKTNYLNSFQLKKQLKKYHMKSLNFVNNLVYFEEIDSLLKLSNQILEFVNIFQLEYCKRNQKQKDSFVNSQNHYEKVKYQSQSNNNQYQIQKQKQREDNLYNFYQKQNIFAKRKQFFIKEAIKQRPFGKIVNSKSPLRHIPSHSNSKSPSEIQTYRQSKITQSPSLNEIKYKHKNIVVPLKSLSNYQTRKQNLSIKNKQKAKDYKEFSNKSIKIGSFLANNQQLQKQEEIIETIRKNKDYNKRSSFETFY